MNASSSSDMDDESDYEDAAEAIAPPTQMDFLESIEDARLAVHYFFNNDFEKARKTLEPWAKSSMYHSLGISVFEFLEAVLTFHPKQIQKASEALRETLIVCNGKRNKGSLSKTIGKMVGRVENLEDEQVHAELCFAEALLLKALLTFVEDETLVSFIKAGIKIRSCYNVYKTCRLVLKTRKWEDEKLKTHFEGGVRMGVGTFNLMISQLPSRAIKLLEFIGFSGSKKRGIEELIAGYELKQSIRQILCVMTLLGYHLVVTYVLSHKDGDLALCEQILKEQLLMYPNGVWFLFYKGRLELLKGNLEEAEHWYEKSWKSQEVWPQFHHLCYWELMWLHTLRMDWSKAFFFSNKLLSQSKWSRTIYSYQKACLLLIMNEKTEEVEDLMRTLPGFKQRIAGKSLPMEKFVIKRSEKFFAQKKWLCLPTVELIYLWNFFKPLSKCKELMLRFLQMTDDALLNVPSNEFSQDNKSLLHLLRGCILRHLGLFMQSQNSFKFIIENGKKLKDDTHLVPYAIVEFALLEIEQKNFSQAQIYLNEAKNNYTGYSLESRLHFKMHSAMSFIDEQKSV